MSWKDWVETRRITPELLERAVRDCNTPDVWADDLDDACQIVGVTTAEEQAMLLAQLGHESQGLNRLVENLNYSVEALTAVFGDHRITKTHARRVGRSPSNRANQMAIANAVYGGEWGLRNLGNTEANDGWRFRGRGLIHTTGRHNYERTSRWIWDHFDLRYDLVAEPERLTEPEIAAMAALAYWMERVKPSTSLEDVTRAINGGLNGIEDRGDRLRVARRAFGLSEVSQ